MKISKVLINEISKLSKADWEKVKTNIDYLFSLEEIERSKELYISSNKIEEKIAKSSEVVLVDPQYFRPTEVDLLIGNPTKSQTILGWKPEYDLKGLVEDMMRSDIKLFKRDAYLKEGGFTIMNYFE